MHYMCESNPDCPPSVVLANAEFKQTYQVESPYQLKGRCAECQRLLLRNAMLRADCQSLTNQLQEALDKVKSRFSLRAKWIGWVNRMKQGFKKYEIS